MTDQQQPDWARNLNAGMAKVADGLSRIGHTFSAQGALAQLVNGDAEAARKALTNLPVSFLAEVETHGRKLTRLARDVRLAKEADQQS